MLRTGSLIYDSQGTFQYDVAPACSGIRSLTALLLLMTIYGFMTYRTMWRRVLVVALSVPLAIFGNTLRLIIVIIAGEAFGQDAGTAIEQKLGFLTFAVALGVILLLGHWLREPPDAEPASSTLSTPPADSGGRL